MGIETGAAGMFSIALFHPLFCIVGHLRSDLANGTSGYEVELEVDRHLVRQRPLLGEFSNPCFLSVKWTRQILKP